MAMASRDGSAPLETLAQRWREQTRLYRRSVQAYGEAMRAIAEVRARTRRELRAPMPTPPRSPGGGVRLAAASREPWTKIVAEPLMPLSQRELQVARLIARGASNDEVARALVITSGTAANHVARIIRKLGVRSRTGIGVWVVERGLATSARV